MLKLCESGHEALAYDDRRHECPACVIGENLMDVKDALKHTQELLDEANTEIDALMNEAREANP